MLSLSDGRALAASFLAAEAGVSAATASSHLAKLTTAGMLSVEARGRHRYFRLKGPDVAQLLEMLQQLAPLEPIRSLRQDTRAYALREARTCYDHIAGRLGVEMMAAMVARGQLTNGAAVLDPPLIDQEAERGGELDYVLTGPGDALLLDVGIGDAVRGRMVRYCVDWSAGHHHLCGALGRALYRRFTELDWIRPAETGRALVITPAGATGFRDVFGYSVAGQRQAARTSTSEQCNARFVGF